MDFVKHIPELHFQRYFLQLNKLVHGKISCGVFGGFKNTDAIKKAVDYLNNFGVNLSCVCVIDDSYVNFSWGGVENSLRL